MNPRILKKVCKRIVELNHPVAKGAWVDDEDSIGGLYIGRLLWGDRKKSATAKQMRSHYMSKTRISRIHVVGGGADYWGEAIDPETVYRAAHDYLLWKYGTPTMHPMKDEHGNVIDEVEGWPEWDGRLTVPKIIAKLKSELNAVAEPVEAESNTEIAEAA